MFDSVQSPATRKRRAPPDHLDNEAQVSQRKRQKLSASADRHHQPSPAFWDGLSQVVFSRRALKEFDRRIHAEQGQFACLPNVTSASSSLSRKRSSTSGRTESTRTSKTSPYSGQYEAALGDAHIYVEGHDYDIDEPPESSNLLEIQQRLMLSRASLSPSRFTEEMFKTFKWSNARARSETRMVQRVMRDISGTDDHFKTGADVEFNNIQPFNKSLAAAKPDLYDGALTSSVRKQVRGDLGPWIIPSTNSTNLVAPNFFAEAKSDKDRADVAKKQACHDNVIGAGAMHSLPNYGAEESEYDGNAYSFSAIYHNSQLQLYATHPTAPTVEGEPAEYHMTQLRSFAMTDGPDSFREGARAYRNVRDMAQECRNGHIEKANDIARAMPAKTSPSSGLNQSSRHSSRTAAPGTDTDTSIDELALSPAPSKRSRHERLPSTPRMPLPRGDLLTPSTTSAENADTLGQASNNALPRRSGRQRQSAKARPTQVAAARQTVKGMSGRSFEYNGKNIFVLDKEWQTVTMSKRPALLCARYNLWFFA